jgi:NADH dehydrogenase
VVCGLPAAGGVLQRLETANLQDDPVRRRAMLTFTVVGAGYAGVELTAQMARLTAHLLPLYPKLPSHDIHWLLVDVAEAVMPELGRRLGESALTLLRRRNVDVRLGVSVTAVTDTQVTLSDGSTLEGSVLIWCAGVTGNPLIAGLGSADGEGPADRR